MKNQPTAINEFVSLRDSIAAERERLLTRLREIDQALGALALGPAVTPYGPRPSRPHARNKISLKETVLKLIDDKSLTKHEILEAVLKSGYTFATDDPLNSLGVILYGKNPKFKNNHGRFSLK